MKKIFIQKSANLNDRGSIASYKISKLTAMEGKPHIVGESLILLAVFVVITTVMNQNACEIIEPIPFSNSSVSRHIFQIAEMLKTN